MQIGTLFSSRRARPLLLTLAWLAAPVFLAQPLPLAAEPAPAETPQAPAAPASPAPTGAPTGDPAAPAAPKPEAPAEEGAIKIEEVAAKVTIQIHGAAKWEEGYAKIGEAIAKLHEAAQKAGLKESGRPMAVFTDTDDAGFKFDAMLPVEAAADAKPDLGADISMAQSPSGKALKFQHRGAYDDIDSTYEAITAYLDEKGLEARNLFVEEYVVDAKDSSDMALQVDIYVFLK
jgi:effector-binding domain-containing protein